MKLPIELKKPTVIESIVQFRFKNKLEMEEVFFKTRTVLEAKGFEYKKEKILELPPAVLSSDPNLKYVAHYSFSKNGFVVSISPQMISFGVKGYYRGWKFFSESIQEIYSSLSGIIDQWSTEIISMRYIDFFKDTDIFSNINLKISLPDDFCGLKVSSKKKVYNTEIECDDNLMLRLQIVDNMELKSENTISKGSIIDIDAFSFDTSGNYMEIIEKMHKSIKIAFFGLLKGEFLETLEPVYEVE